MSTATPATRIRVDAPDAPTAFPLEKRLAHLHPTAISRGPDWSVELEDFDHDRFDEIIAAVEHWLRQIGVRSTQVHIDSAVTTVVASPVDGTSLGFGYDDSGVLEHEP